MASIDTPPSQTSVYLTLFERITQRLDPLERTPLSTLGWIITAVVVLCLLLPSMVYPLGPDLGLFFTAGQKILQGAIHYRDIIDIKPPLIYYLYAGSIWLFGTSAISVHIVDIVLQCITCWLIIITVRRAAGSDLWAAVSAIMYALVYFVLHYGNIIQPESYTGLFGLSMILLLMHSRRPLGFFLVGVLGGILFGLKFSLIALIGVAAVAEFLVFEEGWKRMLLHWTFMGLGAVIVVGLFVVYLVAFGAYDDFLLMQEFTRGYVNIQFASKAEWFRSVSRSVPGFLTDNYSVVMFLATAGGMAWSIPLNGKVSDSDTEPSGPTQLLRLCSIAFIVLLVTVAIEGKFLPYHFSRFYAFSTILAGFGLMQALQLLLSTRLRHRYAAFALVVVVPLMMLFSPIPRYIWHGSAAALILLQGSEAFDQHYNYSTDEQGITLTMIRDVGRWLHTQLRPGDQAFMATSVGGLVSYEAGYIPDFKIFHFAFVAALFGPQQWKDATRQYLFEQRPRFIVVQLLNHEPTLIGTQQTSIEALRSLAGVAALLDIGYRRVYGVEMLEVYERNDMPTTNP